MVLENEFVKFFIDGKGMPVKLIDKITGRDYCADKSSPLFIIKKKKVHKPDSCSYRDGKIEVEFRKAKVGAVIKVECKKKYFVFEVVSVSDEEIEEFTFLNVKVNLSRYVSRMSGVASDGKFAFCLRPLNLQVGPTFPPVLQSTCYKKYGLKGARAALAGCPFDELRPILKELVRTEGPIYSPFGGPFALDADINRYSYAFTYDISEGNVDKWIEIAKKGGIRIIHFNGWYRSLGSYQIRTNLFPNGLAGLKEVVRKIHDAGLKAGMHCLTGLIGPGDPLVTPLPDKRIANDKTFTLAKEVNESNDFIPVLENPQGLDTVWSYASHGNVVQIDDELVQYSGLSEKTPYAFTKCKRGAFNTRPSQHKKGTPAHHFYSFYGGFYPGPDSTLVDEVAQNIANVFNECDFDMIYMDGSEGMPEEWYGVSKMRAAIFTSIKKPIRVEASQWTYHSWPFHSVIGAWDSPFLALKYFIDDHCRHNEEWRTASLMNAQLGWWAINGPADFHDAQLADETEYLACKSLGWDFPMSFQSITVESPANARQNECLEIIGKYEKLRLERHFPDSLLKKLRKPEEDFHLFQAKDGKWQFLPVDYNNHKVTGQKDGSTEWAIENRFPTQPVRFRIQALYGAGPYDGEGLVITDFSKDNEFKSWMKGAGPCSLTPSPKEVKTGKISGCYTAESNKSNRKGAWTVASKNFLPELDISKYGALGVWVYGDNNNELLNLQLSNPIQYYFMFDEHYIMIDFKGWRYFELLLRERDSEMFWKYEWPYKKISATYGSRIANDYCSILNIEDVMSICRMHLVKEHVDKLNIYYNNLPPEKEVKCYISSIKALPAVKVKLTNPEIEIDGKKIVFPVTMESGQYLEFNSLSDCKMYNEKGALIQEIKPAGEVPMLSAGNNKIIFSCEGTKGYNSRAKITVIGSGKL